MLLIIYIIIYLGMYFGIPLIFHIEIEEVFFEIWCLIGAFILTVIIDKVLNYFFD